MSKRVRSLFGYLSRPPPLPFGVIQGQIGELQALKRGFRIMLAPLGESDVDESRLAVVCAIGLVVLPRHCYYWCSMGIVQVVYCCVLRCTTLH